MHVQCLWRGLGRSMILATSEVGADILRATNRPCARDPPGLCGRRTGEKGIPRPLGSYPYFPVQ